MLLVIWLLNKAKNSLILNKFNIHKINNNIDINNFKFIEKDKAKKKLKIKSNKNYFIWSSKPPKQKEEVGRYFYKQ